MANYLYRVKLAEDAMYLQSLVVAREWQGRGIGGALVRFVCEEAQRRGRATVALNVVDRNEGARRLYERMGFVRVHTTRTRLFRPLVGWAAVDLMEKPVVRSRNSADLGGAPSCRAVEQDSAVQTSTQLLNNHQT